MCALNGINCSRLKKNGQVTEKTQHCKGVHEDGSGSWKAEMLEDSVLSRAGNAMFDPGISFPFSRTGRMVRDDSSMRTVPVAMSDSTRCRSIFCTLILVYVYVLGNVTEQQSCPPGHPPCLFFLENTVLTDSFKK